MKIIIIGPAHPYRGGIADTNESLHKALVKAGHDTLLVNFSYLYPRLLFPGRTQYSGEEKPKDIKTVRWLHSINPISWWNTAKQIKKHRPDLVVVRYWTPFLSPALGFVARLLNPHIKLVALCDNILPHEKRWMDRFLTAFFLKPFHAFMTLSKSSLEELDTFTKKPKRFFPHPINYDIGNTVGKEDALTYLGLPPNQNYLLFFGLVRKYKGVDLLLHAYAAYRKHGGDAKLLIVGEFYDDPKEYHELIKKLGVEEDVIIKNEFIPSKEIPYYFAVADMLLQTYHTATQSGVTQLAYHFHCPVLVTNVGGLAEMVEDKKVGYVVEKDVLQIKAALEDFYAKNRKTEFASHIERQKDVYSWDNFVASLIALYEQIK